MINIIIFIIINSMNIKFFIICAINISIFIIINIINKIKKSITNIKKIITFCIIFFSVFFMKIKIKLAV